MRIRMIGEETVTETEDSWGERLIEQGKAIPVPADAPDGKADRAADGNAPEGEADRETDRREGEPETARRAGRKR